MTCSLPHCCLYKGAKMANDLLTPTLLLIQRAKRVNELPTSTLLPVKKNQEDEWLTHSQTVAYTKEQRGWMTYSLPHCCLYKRAKRVNDLLTPTILPLHKSQGCEWLSHSHTVPIQKKLTPTLLPKQKRDKRVKDLLTPTLLLIQKSQDDWWVTHSHTVACKREPRGWMTYTLPHCCLYKRAMRMNDLLTPTLLHTQKSQSPRC